MSVHEDEDDLLAELAQEDDAPTPTDGQARANGGSRVIVEDEGSFSLLYAFSLLIRLFR